MIKYVHEIRDPVHIFIRINSIERNILNSKPFQRLRHIHQLALTYLVYPGATHKRFEHSLGVMELAGRVYDIVTAPDNIHPSVRDVIPRFGDHEHTYWRVVLRMAVLFHDVGHLPFSHAAEKELLPDGWDHERLTLEIINSDEMKEHWDSLKVIPKDVAKLAVGPKKYKEAKFNDWEAILSEIIVGDAFGVDRMDYLLRDSHHAGVSYGKFDHYRLIDTIRILPKSNDDSGEPALGIEEGGIHSAEALLLARYFMYSQLYFHHVRRIYDLHLLDFLKEWLPGGRFPTDIGSLLDLTDNEVTAAFLKAVREKGSRGYAAACCIVNRDHYRLLYQRNPDDVAKNPDSGESVYHAACKQFGEMEVRRSQFKDKSSGIDFPVLLNDGRSITSSLQLSETLKSVPVVAVDYVYISTKCREEADKWLEANRNDIVVLKEEE
ncbi:MAG: HD domain-containing protein [Geobacteraceae bacterium]